MGVKVGVNLTCSKKFKTSSQRTQFPFRHRPPFKMLRVCVALFLLAAAVAAEPTTDEYISDVDKCVATFPCGDYDDCQDFATCYTELVLVDAWVAEEKSRR